MNKQRLFLCVTFILLAAAGLRLYDLNNRGLFYADETRYYRDTLAVKEGIDNYLAEGSPGGIRGLAGALRPLSESLAAKPGNSILGLMGLYVFGEHQSSVLFPGALLGIATVFLVFLMSRKYYGREAGIFAALALAACAAHVLFSRSFMAHSNQAFFLVLAAYLYLSGARALSAFSMGFAFLVHPTGIIYFAPFFLCELYFWVRRQRRFANILAFCACFMVPFILIEVISILGREEFGSLLVALQKSYIAQIFFVNSEALALAKTSNQNLGHFHYVIMSYLANGFIFTALLICGLLFGLGRFFKDRVLSNFILLAIPAAMLIYWQYISAHERLFREILVLFPFFCVAIGVFMSRLNRKLAVLLLALLILDGGWHSVTAVRELKADYSGVEDFLRKENIRAVITPSAYLATTRDVLMPGLTKTDFYIAKDMDDARRIRKDKGTRYIIIHPGDWFYSGTFRLRSNPAAMAAEPHYCYFPHFYEAMRLDGKEEYLKEKYRYFIGSKNVTVYDIKKEESL
ncbi:MAG: glycosyltransferase family 39 protein [Candidatus Omnitrophota bacterium]